jgi:hypothetical protein
MVSGWSILMTLVVLGVAPQNEIKVTGQRPVLMAIEQLRQRHGWRISYEDDPLAGADAYTLAFVYPPPSPPRNDADAAAVLGALVAAHKQLGRGSFAVEQSDAAWRVVPLFGSVLDTKVTLHTDATSPRAAVEAICLAVSRASGRRVIAGRAAITRSKRVQKVAVFGEGESARAVLARALGQFDGPLVWDMIHSAELGGYILSVTRLFTVVGGTATDGKGKDL